MDENPNVSVAQEYERVVVWGDYILRHRMKETIACIQAYERNIRAFFRTHQKLPDELPIDFDDKKILESIFRHGVIRASSMMRRSPYYENCALYPSSQHEQDAEQEKRRVGLVFPAYTPVPDNNSLFDNAVRVLEEFPESE